MGEQVKHLAETLFWQEEQSSEKPCVWNRFGSIQELLGDTGKRSEEDGTVGKNQIMQDCVLIKSLGCIPMGIEEAYWVEECTPFPPNFKSIWKLRW